MYDKTYDKLIIFNKIYRFTSNEKKKIKAIINYEHCSNLNFFLFFFYVPTVKLYWFYCHRNTKNHRAHIKL